MKNYSYILSVLLVFVLSVASAPAKNTGKAACTGTLRSTEQTLLTPDYADSLATETVQMSIPSAQRVMRKPYDRLQKLSVEIRDAYAERNFSSNQSGYLRILIARLQSAKSFAQFRHNADYLRFGILLI